MEWLNYHHLLYFWTVVREGSLVAASRSLRLAHPTVSVQLRQLESSLGAPLFDRTGRRLELTELGRLVYRYADEIFTIGRELMTVARHGQAGRPIRLSVGVTDAMPKLVVRQLLQPAFELSPAVVVTCREDRLERALASLAVHDVDVVLSDAPVMPGSGVRAFNHVLGECGVSFVATRAVAGRLNGKFPACLDGAPFLLPTASSALRRSLDLWMGDRGLRPALVAEFDDSALLKVFGEDGLGVCCVPAVLEAEVRRKYGVQVIGRTDDVIERYYAISGQRRDQHPAVVAITAAARVRLFGSEGRRRGRARTERA